MVNGKMDAACVFFRVFRQQAQGGNVHGHHIVRLKIRRPPVALGIGLIGLRGAGVRQQIGGLAHVPQRLTQGGGGADGVAVGAHMGQQQHPIHGLQHGCRFLNGHLMSSGSTMFSFSGLAGFTWFSMSRMWAP